MALTWAELKLLVQVSAQIGLLGTFVLCILTAGIGSGVARWQGFQTLQQIQARMAVGEAPGQQVVEGLLLLVSGIVLFLPGFLTDGIGFLLLVPPVRGWLARRLQNRLAAQIVAAGPGGFGAGMGFGSPYEGPAKPEQGRYDPASKTFTTNDYEEDE